MLHLRGHYPRLAVKTAGIRGNKRIMSGLARQFNIPDPHAVSGYRPYDSGTPYRLRAAGTGPAWGQLADDYARNGHFGQLPDLENIFAFPENRRAVDDAVRMTPAQRLRLEKDPDYYGSLPGQVGDRSASTPRFGAFSEAVKKAPLPVEHGLMADGTSFAIPVPSARQLALHRGDPNVTRSEYLSRVPWRAPARDPVRDERTRLRIPKAAPSHQVAMGTDIDPRSVDQTPGFNPDLWAFKGGLVPESKPGIDLPAWISAIPGVSAGYASSSPYPVSRVLRVWNTADLSPDSPSVISSKRQQGMEPSPVRWTPHLAEDVRHMSDTDVRKLRNYGGNAAVGDNPYYEAVVNTDTLRQAKPIAEYGVGRYGVYPRSMTQVDVFGYGPHQSAEAKRLQQVADTSRTSSGVRIPEGTLPKLKGP